MAKPNKKLSLTSAPVLWAASGFLAVALLFSRVVFTEYVWITAVLGVLFVAFLVLLIRENQAALKTRSAAYGVNSLVTITLVIAIVGVLNFLASRYPQKLDFTKNKINTFSDQTIKLVRGLSKPVKATFFAKASQREQVRPLLDNYKSLNPKFEVEYVDADKEPSRAKMLNIRKYNTLDLAVNGHDAKVEDPTEEKITNALIKLLKDKSPTACAVTGHGERSFSSQEADGYLTVKTALTNQFYEVRDINLAQEGKISESCDAIMILGPTKSFFPPEVKMIKDYLENGGRALVALDIDLKGATQYAPDLIPILEEWHVHPVKSLVVDPLAKMFGAEASIPILQTYSKENAITRDVIDRSYFPFAQLIEILPEAPAGMKVQWLAKTHAQAWGVTDLETVKKGAIQFVPAHDKKGPLDLAVAVDGKLKDSKATKNTRLVVFGTSLVGTNNYSRYGANLDLVANAVSWILEDESLISIRTKEEGAGHVELSRKSGAAILLITVILIPLLIGAAGIVIWVLRRRL